LLAVDAGVVHLGHHRQPPAVVGVGAGDVLDHPHLPQRAAAVQLQRGDVPADLGQLDAAARARQPDPVHVPVDVEIRVLDPYRVVEVERRVGQLLAELRHGRDALAEHLPHLVEAVAARNGGGVEFQHRAHVQGLLGGLQIEEAGVESAEPLVSGHGRDRRRLS